MLGRSPSAEKHMSNVLAVEAREGPNTSFHGAFLACLHCDTNNNELRFLLFVDELVRTNTTRSALVGEFMVAFLLVFIASRTAVNSDFFIRRWHALQLVRRSSLISHRTGFNSVCIRKESCTPCQQQDCVRWCHHLCQVLPVGVLIRPDVFNAATVISMFVCIVHALDSRRTSSRNMCR